MHCILLGHRARFLALQQSTSLTLRSGSDVNLVYLFSARRSLETKFLNKEAVLYIAVQFSIRDLVLG